MTKQFYHQTSEVWEKKRTFCVQTPTKGYFFNFINNSCDNNILGWHINIGVSICSNLDQFNKKTGRELSESRLKEEEITLQSVFLQQNLIFVSVITETGINLQFRLHKNSPHVFLIYAE